jgi:hypothetical protein
MQLDMAELGCGVRRGFAICAREEGRAAEVEPNGEEVGAAMVEAAARWKKEVAWRRGVACSNRPGE